MLMFLFAHQTDDSRNDVHYLKTDRAIREQAEAFLNQAIESQYVRILMTILLIPLILIFVPFAF